jgi:large conductance mechanosensitive channel
MIGSSTKPAEKKPGIAEEFKKFAIKGNVIDLAVGVIIGAGFGKIVDSVVNDLVMPVMGRIFGRLDFSNYYIPLAGQGTDHTLVEAKKLGAVLAYGNFMTISLNFAILAVIIFFMVKEINKLKALHESPKPDPVVPEDITLLREIRDHLKQLNVATPPR